MGGSVGRYVQPGHGTSEVDTHPLAWDLKGGGGYSPLPFPLRDGIQQGYGGQAGGTHPTGILSCWHYIDGFPKFDDLIGETGGLYLLKPKSRLQTKDDSLPVRPKLKRGCALPV